MLRPFRNQIPPKKQTPEALQERRFDVWHAGETFQINLKRSTTARRFTLRVRVASRDVLLTIPHRGSLAEAKSFAERNAAWIGARLRRLPERIGFNPGDCAPLRGVMHQIVHHPARRGGIWLEDAELVGEAPLLCVAADAAFVPRRVLDFLKREAKREIEAAVAGHARKLDVEVRTITLRDTRSRWGSCSASGRLSFSWRLIMAPPFVLDYLAAHEVAHLAHMNHSPAFWRAVACLSNETALAEAWLKAHGSRLLQFGPTKT